MAQSILGPEWNLSPDGINIVTDNGKIKDTKIILKNALNSDLKIIGKPCLHNEKNEIKSMVLQIQNIRNISVSKAKEDSQSASRMLRITLTDGESSISAIERDSIVNISRDKTAPGTKVHIKGAKILSGFLLINPQNFQILGGQVDNLYDKWVVAKSVLKNHQSVFNSGAPPWVSFGRKIMAQNQDLLSFKSLESSTENEADSEFDQQRKEAIAEVSTGAIKKTFGGRVRENVQPIQNKFSKGTYSREPRKSKFDKRDENSIEKLQKPSEKVSLFSFLEDKLPINESPAPTRNNLESSAYSYKNLPQKTAFSDDFNKRKPNQYASNYNEKSNNFKEKNNHQQQFHSANKQQKYSNKYGTDTKNAPKPWTKSNNAVAETSHELHELANNLSKISVSTQFASRSIRQHLNLGPAKVNHSENNKIKVLKIGDHCMAKYWEDGKFYPAIVSAVTEKTYAVQFKGYGNIEEVLQEHCFSSNNNINPKQQRNRDFAEFTNNSRGQSKN